MSREKEYVATNKLQDDKFFQVNMIASSGALPSLKLFYSRTFLSPQKSQNN